MEKHLDKRNYDFSHYNEARIGVLSDTHSYINPSVVKHLSGCDLILHAGDIGSVNIIKQLHEISDKVISVCGNNDTAEHWNTSEHENLAQVPKIAKVELPGGMIALTHGDEHFSEYDVWHEKLRNNFPTAKAIIYGHSHRLVCDQSSEPWVLNPGAAGETRTQKHGVSCLLMNVGNEKWEVKEIKI